GAKRVDDVLSSSEQTGVMMDLVLFDYKVWGDGNSECWCHFFSWIIDGDNPDAFYKFWSDSRSRDQIKRDIRYLIARFGYSPSLGFWELTNEMYNSWKSDIIAPGLQDVVNYIQANDPYNHLVTNSYDGSPGAEVYERMPGIDVSSVHYYMNDDSWPRADGTYDGDEYMWAVERTKLSEERYDLNGLKPWISGEFGLWAKRQYDPDPNNGTQSDVEIRKWEVSRWADADPSHDAAHWIDSVDGSQRDQTGVFFHNAVWSMLMANAFKSSVSNWWTIQFSQWNYQRHYTAPSRYAQTLPFHDAASLRLSTYSDPAILNGGVLVASSNSNIRVLGRKRGNSAYLWAQNKNNIWSNRIKDGNSIVAENGTVTIPGFTANADLTVKYFDTISGNVTQTLNSQTDGSGNLSLNIALGTDFTTTNKPDVAIQVSGEDIPLPTPLISNISPATYQTGTNQDVGQGTLSYY
ncbi:MAG: hypothetical protein U0946_07065, partial [Patescibacteria group bacterium]|nr:hypothetical protein [Patescibacteria group bacterium]